MSSVGSSDSSNRSTDNEVVRRNREDYRKKETDLIKKHQKEVARITQQHHADMERVQKNHEKQMAQLQKSSNDAISERDHKHQRDIEDVRAMHRKQVQNMAEETQRRESVVRDSMESDFEAQRRRNEERVEHLNEAYRSDLEKKSEQYSNNLQESREQQKEAIDENREKLQKTHGQELKSMREGREAEVRDLKRQYRDFRTQAQEDKRNSRIQSLREKDRSSEHLMRAVGKEREAREEAVELMREGYQEAMHKMRERYDEALKKESDAHRFSEENLKSSVTNRINNEVEALRTENADLKEANIHDQVYLKAEKEREVRGMRNELRKNLDNYREQRDEAIRQSNQQSAEDIRNVKSKLDKQMVETARFYRGKMSEQNRIHRTAYENLKGDFEARNEQTQVNAEDRVKRLREATEQQKAKLIDINVQNREVLLQTKEDEMKVQREILEDDKNHVVNRMQDMMRKQEIQHGERMTAVVSKYEKQVQMLKDQLQRQHKQNDDNVKRLTDELTRLHKMEMDQIEAKNRDKVRQMNEMHAQELRTVNKRNDERVDQLIGELKKS